MKQANYRALMRAMQAHLCDFPDYPEMQVIEDSTGDTMIFRGVTVVCDCCHAVLNFKGPQRSTPAVMQALELAGWKHLTDDAVHCPACVRHFQDGDKGQEGVSLKEVQTSSEDQGV